MAERLRIIEETPTRLSFQVRASPWGLAVVWVLAAVVAVWLGPTYRIRCLRSGERSARCHVQRQFLGIRLSDRVVTNVFGAVVQSGNVDNSRPPWRCLSNLAFLTSHGLVSVTSASLWGHGGQGRAASALHEFLDAKGSIATEIRLHSSPFNWLIGLCALAWTAVATACPSLRCTLDKEQGQVLLLSGRIWRKATSYWFDDIDRFAVRQKVIVCCQQYGYRNSPLDEGGALHNDAFDRELVLTLCLKNGEEITLAQQMFSGQPALRFVRRLEQFRRPAPAGERSATELGDWMHNS